VKFTPERKLDSVLGGLLGADVKPAMDLHKIISELQSEKQRLDEAIQALERLSAVAPREKKRGRPPLGKHSQEPDAPQSKAQGQ
jgi:hypothetical protein